MCRDRAVLALLRPAVWYAKSRAKDQSALRQRIRDIAMSRPRFGYLRVLVMLEREGWKVGQEAGLSLLSSRRAATAHEGQAAQADRALARRGDAGESRAGPANLYSPMRVDTAPEGEDIAHVNWSNHEQKSPPHAFGGI